MDIKRIIRSQKIRHKILKSLWFIPDRLILPIQYRILLHRWPNLKSPKRFTEWIQVYKMKYRNPVMPQCVDKYSVREYVIKKLGDVSLLNTLYQVCDKAEEIDFYKLPSKFVIKTTNGGNGDNVLIVKDKLTLNIPEAISKINKWLNKDYSSVSREWAYNEATKHPRIIIEEYLENSSDLGLIDYKFYCFSGKVRFLSVDWGRFGNHTRAYYDEEFKLLPEITGNYSLNTQSTQLPNDIVQMKEVAEKLASDFPFVRVDLYNVYNRIIFGELTFYPASGYSPYNPDSFDEKLGDFFPSL